MNIELRADGLHLNGYVNVTGKISRPIITRHGKCVELIEERAFERALERRGEVNLTVDHDSTHIYASTNNSTLRLSEDAIGLKAEVLITDSTLINLAKKGEIKGWSFGMYNVVDELEERANEMPLRRIKDLDLDHVTLVVNKSPIYSATSVELRAGEEHELETRGTEVSYKPMVDYSSYETRLKKIKEGN